MKLYDDIEINRVSEDSSIVYNPVNNKYIKMGNREIKFLETFYNDIDVSKKKEEFTNIQIAMTEKFLELGLIGDEDERENTSAKSKFKIKDLSKIKLVSFNVDKMLNFLKPLGNILFTAKAGVIFFSIWLLSIAIFIFNLDSIANDLIAIKDITSGQLIIIYVLLLLTLIIHEFSHGMACVRFGGKVRKMGIMLFYLQFAAYCDVSGIYVVDKKYKKVITLLAGILSQLVISSFTFILYYILMNVGCSIPLLLYFSLINVVTSIINLIPFVKLDGYWIMSVVLNIYNLREKSFESIIATLIGKGKAVKDREHYKTLIIYSILAFVVTILMWFTGIIGILGIIQPYVNAILYEIILYISIAFMIFFIIKSALKYVHKVKEKY